MKSPFPWFGGKRRVADIVWSALGDVDNYIEPFAGSLAVLLERPEWHTGTCETINDADRYVANFWRALKMAPDEVALHADWPVSEADLEARHLWLVNTGAERIEKMFTDPDFYDAKVAGWWVWGICQWIGSGWCSGDGPWRRAGATRGVNRKLPHLGDDGRGVNRKLPHLGNEGRGVNRQLPHLGDEGRGVNRKLPHLGDEGQGVNRQLPHLGDEGRGITSRSAQSGIYNYMNQLSSRLRRVRVCCGDWSRVVTNGAMSHGDSVGVFLDPPYGGDVRTPGLYASDDLYVSASVREWALSNADNPRLRIVLCGYEGEHDMPSNWEEIKWSSSGAYMGGGNNELAERNRHRERIWLSPGCQKGQRKDVLFQT